MPQETVDKRRPDGTFGPGNRANPGGRPKGSLSLSAILREVLSSTPEGGDKTYARGIVEATVRDALKGDAQARKLCWAYIEGAPAQSVALSGPGGGAVRVDATDARELLTARINALASRMSEEEGER